METAEPAPPGLRVQSLKTHGGITLLNSEKKLLKSTFFVIA